MAVEVVVVVVVVAIVVAGVAAGGGGVDCARSPRDDPRMQGRADPILISLSVVSFI
jgi:hypothetical protein